MMNDKLRNGVIVVLAIGAVILSLLAVFKPTPERVVEKTVVEKQTLGSLASPNISSPYLNVNGVDMQYVSGDCKNASTTQFSVNPYWGISTSSVLYFSVAIEDRGASTTNTYFTISTTTVATTSLTNAYIDQNTLYEHQQGYARKTSLIGTATTTSLMNLVELTSTTTLIAGVLQTGDEGGMAVDANSKARIGVGKFQKVIGYVESASNSATDANGVLALKEVTGNNNTFACSYEGVFMR